MRLVFLFLVYPGALAYFLAKVRKRYGGIMDALAAGTAAVEHYFSLPFASSAALNEKVVAFDGFLEHRKEKGSLTFDGSRSVRFPSASRAEVPVWRDRRAARQGGAQTQL